MEKIDNSFRLPKEFKDRWLEALRSGKYRQGKVFFHADGEECDEYCVLGIAGLIAGYTKEELNGYATYGKKSCKPKKDLPKELIGFNALVSNLTVMNDHGYTFIFLADYIERNVQTY